MIICFQVLTPAPIDTLMIESIIILAYKGLHLDFFSISFLFLFFLFFFFFDIDIDEFIYLFIRVTSRKEVFVSLRHVIFIHVEQTTKAKTKLHCLIFVFQVVRRLIIA